MNARGNLSFQIDNNLDPGWSYGWCHSSDLEDVDRNNIKTHWGRVTYLFIV